MRHLLFLLMYDFISIKGNKMKLLVMCTWPKFHSCILCMKRKSIKENETRVITLLNQFTYKVQNKQTNKTKQIHLTYLIWKEKKKKHTGKDLEN